MLATQMYGSTWTSWIAPRPKSFLSGLVPGTVGRLRLRPPLRDGQDEPLAPAAQVVADVGDDLVPLGLRLGGIALDVFDRRHRLNLPVVTAASEARPDSTLGLRERQLHPSVGEPGLASGCLRGRSGSAGGRCRASEVEGMMAPRAWTGRPVGRFTGRPGKTGTGPPLSPGPATRRYARRPSHGRPLPTRGARRT